VGFGLLGGADRRTCGVVNMCLGAGQYTGWSWLVVALVDTIFPLHFDVLLCSASMPCFSASLLLCFSASLRLCFSALLSCFLCCFSMLFCFLLPIRWEGAINRRHRRLPLFLNVQTVVYVSSILAAI
jgi:hypothetical protein